MDGAGQPSVSRWANMGRAVGACQAVAAGEGWSRHRLSQTDFAHLLGVSPATVRKWERGTGQPSGAAKTLLAVARAHPEIVRQAATTP